MKYCPICNTEYSEEMIRFCTKDGTPLLNTEASNNLEDDDEQQTIIRTAKPIPIEDKTAVIENFSTSEDTGGTNEQNVGQQTDVPTEEWHGQTPPINEGQSDSDKGAYAVAASQSPINQNNANSIPNQSPQPPKKSKSRVGIILGLLALFGFLFLALAAGGAYLYMQSGTGSDDIAVANNDANAVANDSTEGDDDINLTEDDTNENTENSNLDENSNSDSNDNKTDKDDDKKDDKTPTPTITPKKTPTPRKTPTPTSLPDDEATTSSPKPPKTPTPRPIKTPTPRPTRSNIPKRISGGVINGKATSLPKPVYPAAARAANIKGSVSVAVVISKSGSVMSASATSGHPLLRRAAVTAARRARFAPTKLSGQPVEVSGVIVYNFQ